MRQLFLRSGFSIPLGEHSMIIRGRAAFVLAIAGLCVMACRQASEKPSGAVRAEAKSTAAPSSGWTSVRDAIIEDYLRAHPVFAVVSGRHEYDGLLPDWSAEGIAGEIRRLHAARDRALAVPETTLDEKQRFEREYLVARMDRDLFWLETAEAPFKNPAFYLDWMVDNLDPAPYLTRNYAP